MADFLTFLNIKDEIKRATGKPKGSINSLIEMVINQVYLNEIISADSLWPLFWLTEFDDTLAAVAPGTISAITKADPGIITIDAAHGLVDGDIVMIHNITGMTELNGRMVRVGTVGTTTVSNDNFEIVDIDDTNISTSAYTTYVSGGKVNHHGKTLSTSVRNIIVPKWVGNYKMTPVEVEELEESNNLMGDNTAGNPDRYRLRKHFTAAGVETNQLIWYPGAGNAKDLRYWYETRVAKLTADGHVPLLPYEFHPALISGSIVRLGEYDTQIENPTVWAGIYGAHIKGIRDYNRAHYDQYARENNKKPFLI